jgi:hypothetical protein
MHEVGIVVLVALGFVRVTDIPEQNAPADFCEGVRLLKDLLERALRAAYQHIW